MFCIRCLEDKDVENKTVVLESRRLGDTVYRRRKCTCCNEIIYSEEKEVEDNTGLKNIWLEMQRERRCKRGK